MLSKYATHVPNRFILGRRDNPHTSLQGRSQADGAFTKQRHDPQKNQPGGAGGCHLRLWTTGPLPTCRGKLTGGGAPAAKRQRCRPPYRPPLPAAGRSPTRRGRPTSPQPLRGGQPRPGSPRGQSVGRWERPVPSRPAVGSGGSRSPAKAASAVART